MASSTSRRAPRCARQFAGQSGLLLVAVDVNRLIAPLKWERSRGGDLFPHLYGMLPVSAAIWIEPMPIGADGQHVWPSRLPLDL
jgi:uncharacterized protein (DUF952 family)